MSAPILATKLFIPQPRPKIVLRPRLIERLNEGLHRQLTLISAPAGFGKTTLIAEWIAGGQQREPKIRAAWLSLDEEDNDPTRFLSYFIAALQTLEADIGKGVLAALHSPQPPPIEAILTALLNEIAAVPDPFLLVLDDYHLIDAQPIDDALTFLLRGLPPQMHLVITTREDPNLPLARLRVRGQLTELRAAGLRFTHAEAADFLNQVMGLNLSAEDIAALESRTEGWIAGLQLAALVLQGSLPLQGYKDTAAFMKAFTGSHRFVMDYLVEEVLQQQSPAIQTFLLCTSILDRLCGPLCDALLPTHATSGPETGGQQTLEYLEQANLFIVPLDNERRWYRYHHLFADVLQARLMKEQPNQVAALHLRASMWNEQNNFRSDAIRHALAAEDFERAADLIEPARSEMRGNYFRSATWFAWVKALPDEIVRTRPMLTIGLAWELLFLGELEAAEARLRDGDRLLEHTEEAPAAGLIVANEEEFQSLRASLAIAWAFYAQARGDAANTVKHARRALTHVPETDYHTHGLASSLLGLASLADGDLESVYNNMAEAMANLRMAGNLLFATSGVSILADIRLAQGRLLEAISIYEQALRRVAAESDAVLPGTADLHFGLGELYLESDNLEAARQHLLKGEELGEEAVLENWPYRLYLAQAQMKQFQGELDGALELLERAEKLYRRSPVPAVRPIAAWKARLWVQQDKLAEAWGWAREQGLTAEDDLSYLREYEHITLARILIAHDRHEQAANALQEATGLLDRLLNAAEAGGRTGSVIEILVLQALAYRAHGDNSAAFRSLQRALMLAAPEGYVRLFVNEGEPMAQLLSEAAAQRIMPDYTGKVLASFEAEAQRRQDKSASPDQPFLDPLSRREVEVLQHIAQGLTNQEIADRLYLSLYTVKVHARNIYSKLGVNNRTQAVARARELGVLPHG